MSYRTQAALARDQHIVERVTACAATQEIPNPSQWAWSHQWTFSAQPGWDAAYAYAVNTGVVDPGNSESVITDGMILSAVQAVRADETAPGQPAQ